MSGKKIIIGKKGGVICIKESFMQGTKVATKTMFVVEDTWELMCAKKVQHFNDT